MDAPSVVALREPSEGRGTEERLDVWLAAHGPLAAGVALVVALEACARASRLSAPDLRAAIGSLAVVHLYRDGEGGWAWRPQLGAPVRRPVSDGDIVERVGAILFEALTAQPPPAAVDESLASTRLRALRPDLLPAQADLVAHALTARGDPGVTLEGFARVVRAQLAARERRRSRWRSARWWGAAGAATLTGLAAIAWMARGTDPAERVGQHGLTPAETTLYDMSLESADYNAVVGEHTYGVQLLQQVDRVLQARFGPTDVRVRWILLREAWVRTLAGDRLTAEQYLTAAPESLADALGHAHPYTRAARLALADTVEARGDRATAARLRAEAAAGMRALVPEPELAAGPGPGALWPLHVVAHVAPNAPALEGFRVAPDGRYLAPVTSIQRWLAEREGWRLHVRATGTCRASVVVGADPRQVGVVATRAAGAHRAWSLQFAGTAPTLALSVPAAESVGATVTGRPDGTLVVHLADGAMHEARIDPAAPPPTPPYVLAFSEEPGNRGCAVVSWEVLPGERPVARP